MICWSDVVITVCCYSLLFSQCEQQAMTLIDSTWHTRQLLNPKLVHDFLIYLKIFLLQDSNFLLLIGSIDAMSPPLLCLNICPETLRSEKHVQHFEVSESVGTPVTKLGEVDEVSANHVGEVGHSWLKDGVHSKTTDFFLKIASCFNSEPRQFHIHHFVLNANDNSWIIFSNVNVR